MSNFMGNNIKDDLALQKVCEFLKVDSTLIEPSNVVQEIKDACELRFARAMGIRYGYNHKAPYFEFFGSIMGEAVSQHLGLNIQIAPDKYRLVKYNGVNLVNSVRHMLETCFVEEAFVKAFEFLEGYFFLI